MRTVGAWRARNHPGYWAFVVHRVSGVALAVFLPIHFFVLGQALHHAERLEGFLHWTEQPLVKFSEWVVVVLLAAHFAGGLRILALEFLAWREWHKKLAAAAAAFSIAYALAYALALL